MKRTNIMYALIASLFLLLACDPSPNRKDTKEVAEEINEDKPEKVLSEDATDFLSEAASAGMLEVQLGQMAIQKGVSPAITEYGQRMVNDHTKANKQLKELAAKKNVTLPTAIFDKHQRIINRLTSERGEEFDEEYMEIMVDSHEDVINKFEEAQEDVEDAEIKAWVSKTLPALKIHYESAERLEEAIDDNEKTARNTDKNSVNSNKEEMKEADAVLKEENKQ